MQVINFGNKAALVFLVFVQLWCVSCHRNASFFFVKNEGAIMPVKVSGNPDAQTFIILLPGGPSGDGLVYRNIFPIFKKYLEPACRMVYYDQRGAGNCQGVYDTTTLHLQQLSEDLDKVVSVIQERYSNPRIYLLGYSYGGAVGMTYLLQEAYQSKIKGFISVSGAFDRRNQTIYQGKLVESWLDQWVAEGYLENYEALREGYACDDQTAQSQCKRDSIRTREKVEAKLAQIEAYNRFKVNPASLAKLLGFAFFSQSNPILSSMNEARNGQYYQSEFNDLLLSDRVGAVKIPVLFISSRFDTNVPWFDAQRMYDQIGTPPKDKSLILLERSGHLPMLTEPVALSGHILQFITNRK